MKVTRSLHISRKQLAAHKLRTVLALAGISTGVAAVILMVAIGQGTERAVLARIDEMGTNLLIVSAGTMPTSAARARTSTTATTLVSADAEAILETSTAVLAVAPVVQQKAQVKYEQYRTNTTVVGTTPSFTNIRDFYPAYGSFFTEEETRASRRVAVVGQAIVENLFSGINPTGEYIRIGNVPFEIIGVMEKKGVDLNGTDQDNQIFIPIRTAQRRLQNVFHLDAIYVRVQDRERLSQTAEEIRWLLRDRHRLDRLNKPDDFTILNQEELRATQVANTGTFTLLIGSIAAVSLLVGGVGILAVMLMTVRERRQEVGLRMAVGARRSDVLLQFMLEASMLSVGGGIVGISIGVVTALLVQAATSWTTYVEVWSILLSFGFSVMIGLFFGIYPAHKASLLDPIVALRLK